MQPMQQATHPRISVHTAHDAHIVFEAVRQRRLPAITRRLNDVERSSLVASGAVFVWVESEDDQGLRRWTDGRVWGQSRMREPYLFYDERMPYTQETPAEPRGPTFRFVDSNRTGQASAPVSHQDRATQHHTGLVKQAYSAFVCDGPLARPQKWHLTAYFTYADLQLLPRVEQDPLLSGITVPEGVYQVGRRARGGSEEEDGSRQGSRGPEPPVGGSSAASPDQIILPGLSPIQTPRVGATAVSEGIYIAGQRALEINEGEDDLRGGSRGPDSRTAGSSSSPDQPILPSLASIHPTTGQVPLPPGSRPHGQRLPEDQRMIEKLNSNHIR